MKKPPESTCSIKPRCFEKLIRDGRHELAEQEDVDLSGRQKSGIRINGKEAGAEVLSNRYRTGGFRISLDEFNAACDSAKEINIIEIRK